MNLQLNVLTAILIFLSCSNDDTFRGSGNIVTESRELNGFTKIYNPSSADVIISYGTSQSTEVSADDTIIGSVKTNVENGIFNIDLAKGNYVDVTITVSVTIPNFEELKNTGSGNITVSGFEALTGLAIDNGGSGNITLSGSGMVLNLKNAGSGSYNGFGFIVNNCAVANSGSGNCEIQCTDELSGSNSGSGSLLYKGNPTVDVSNTGSGQVVDSN